MTASDEEVLMVPTAIVITGSMPCLKIFVRTGWKPNYNCAMIVQRCKIICYLSNSLMVAKCTHLHNANPYKVVQQSC